MNLYYLVFLIAILYLAVVRKHLVNSKFFLALFLLYVAVFVGLGDMIGGYDRYIYGEVFDTIADETWGKKNYASLLYLVDGKEYGYFLWQILCSYITANRYIYILLSTLLIYFLCYRAIEQYAYNYPLACIIFLGLFYYFTMTYLRQVLACGIAWQGVKYIWERKPIKFFSCVLLAYFFHSSALIFLPIYFLPIKKYSKIEVTFVLLLCLIISLSPLPYALLANISEEIGKKHSYANQEQGFRIEYVLEALFFLFLIFTNYNKIPNDRKSITFLNISFVFCAILLLFMRFGQGGRFAWYYIIGIICTLTSISTIKNAQKWTSPFIILTSLLLFIRISWAWSFNLSPYKTFLVDGFPSGDIYIYEYYEYNWDYTYDKFCRPIFTFSKK